MSKQTINIGASPNDGTGTPLRTSFDYTNQNFTELYTALGGGVGLPGATTQVIFNDGGTNLAGDAGLVYNKTTDALTIAGLVTAGSATITGALTLTGGTANGVPYLNASKVVTTGTNLSFANTPGVFDTTLNINSLVGTANYKGGITVTEDNASFTLFGGSAYKLIQASGYTTPNQLSFYASNAEQYRIGASGVFNWYDGAGGLRMTLNSTGLGIAATPLERLTVAGTGSFGGTGNTGIKFHSASPLSNNLCWLLSNDQANSNVLNLYYYSAGVFSGRALVVDQSGNFMVRTPATAPTIPDNEMMVFNLTSNTNLRISVKGTDGTTRTANITLA